MTPGIKIYKSSTEEYHHAFQVFLDHTDQKTKAKEWLEASIRKLPSRRVFIDAGAGNGKVTAWFTDLFERTLATEPNESLRKELKTTCPKAEVYGDTILESSIAGPADFVLSSHVFYYIPAGEWGGNLEKIASWLSAEGTAAVVLQNHGTDCMKMLRHFLNKSFDLRPLAENFKKQADGRYQITLETVPAHIRTKTFEDAMTIAEFMLNLLPLEEAPPRQEVEAYVRKNFSTPGGFSFSCSQDFLTLRR